MKKILLVNTNIEQYPYPVPPLGLCLLAAYLKPRYEVQIFDGSFHPAAQLPSYVADYQPDFIGIGIRNIDNMTADNLKYYVDGIIESFIIPVKKSSHVPLILGGSGFSIFPDELMSLTGADFGIVGEAEYSFPELIDCLNENRSYSHIALLYTKERSERTKVNHKQRNPLIGFSDIDRCIDYTPYLQRSSYPVQTKRGCAHRCLYCSYPLIEGSIYRTRAPKDIADEIERVYHRLGAISFEFVDSTFNDPPVHAEEICKQIISRNIPVSFRTMGINPVNVTPELIGLMREAGFRQIDCTPDTASAKMLLNLKKNFRKEHIIQSARLFRESEMPVMWFFLFGGPGEDIDSIMETEDFIGEHIDERDMAHMSAGMRIYPGTGLYKTALNEHQISGGQSLLEPVFYQPEKITLDEIRKILAGISLRHYNCVPSAESTPAPEMIRQAILMQKQMLKPEPMFRTLLRIRKEDRIKKLRIKN